MTTQENLFHAIKLLLERARRKADVVFQEEEGSNEISIKPKDPSLEEIRLELSDECIDIQIAGWAEAYWFDEKNEDTIMEFLHRLFSNKLKVIRLFSNGSLYKATLFQLKGEDWEKISTFSLTFYNWLGEKTQREEFSGNIL
jgi:hypothetical protein